MNRLRCWLRLQQTPQLGIVTALRLVADLGEPDNWVGRKGCTQGAEYLSAAMRAELESSADPTGWDIIRRLIEKYDITWRTVLDNDYPAMLRAIYAPPPVLFVRGDLRDDDLRRPFAIVGTRKPSNYGRQMTETISADLVRAGCTVISGMAYGIDTAAHTAALKAGGRTVAVLACGLDRAYPPTNRELARRICDQGALVSELLPGEDPFAGSFVQRNRIISGLSLGTLVVEGGIKSGALVTAKFALEQGREVFALPGDVTREQSAGPLQLMRLGAKPVATAADILDDFGIDPGEDAQQHVFPELTPDEDKLYQILLKHREGIDVDSLYMQAGVSIAALSALLLQLDLKGLLKRLPGNRVAPQY